MSLGLCCHYLTVNNKNEYHNLLRQRKLQCNKFKQHEYDKQYISTLYVENLQTLLTYLPIVFEKYKCFRFPSGIFPLYDLVDRDMWDNDKTRLLLQKIGHLVLSNNVRATFHPGQFCVLSSNSVTVRQTSINEIEHHSWLFDTMGLPQSTYYAINIHGGKRNNIEFLIDSINKLSPSAMSRLTLENDECSWSVCQLLEVFKKTGVPIVFDSHHHTFLSDDIDIALASNAAKETWGNIKPLQHISNSSPLISEHSSFSDKRHHSDYIHNVPNYQLCDIINDVIDCDVEAKLKNIAIEKLREDFNIHT